MNFSKKVQFEALTYDDVLLLPGYSDFLPHESNTRTKFTKNIELNIPLISAAMDTVTESKMAITMAQEGGIGILHKNMSIEAQAQKVRLVKRSESGMIVDPITMSENGNVGDALLIMKIHKIGGIPVIDKKSKLVGIVTNRDLRFEKNIQKSISDVMTKSNIITTEKGTSLAKAEQIFQNNKIEKLPVVNKNNELVGLITYRDIIKTKEKPNACKDSFGRLRVGAAIGITSDVMDRVKALVDAGVDVVCLDTAHGHSKGVIDVLKKIKKQFSNLDVVVGNVATSEGAKALAEAGADAVKVGVGPGSICTTRIIAGVGMPQLSAVMKAAEATAPYGCPIIADGGIKYSGDMVKALAGGANTIMIGSLLGGTEESPGEIIIYEGRKFKAYRGMGSIEAMEQGSKDRYFQSGEEDSKKLVPEGIVGRVDYKGYATEVLYQMVGGLKAGMGYCGSKTIQELQEKAQFVKITASGMRESHPHDVHITREAPNYSR